MSTPWTEDERTSVRKYLGYSSLFTTMETRVDSAMTSVQAKADGGVLATDSVQVQMRAALATLASIDAKIQSYYCSLNVIEAGAERVKIDSTKAIFMLRSEGRKTIAQLAIPLGTVIMRDYYSGVPVADTMGEGSWLDSRFGRWDV